MGKTMKFKFQNKREVFLIHEDSEKQGLWAELGWDDQDYHSPSQLGRIGRSILHQPSQWKTIRRSLTSSPIQYGKIWKSSIQHPRIMYLRQLCHQRRPRRYGARRTRRHRPLLLLQVRTKRPQPDQVWRKVLLFDLKPRASLGEVPSPKSNVSLYLLSIKIDKIFQNQNKNLLLYFPFP